MVSIEQRIQSDQEDISWEFLDDEELAKHGESLQLITVFVAVRSLISVKFYKLGYII